LSLEWAKTKRWLVIGWLYVRYGLVGQGELELKQTILAPSRVLSSSDPTGANKNYYNRLNIKVEKREKAGCKLIAGFDTRIKKFYKKDKYTMYL
jgi:hypothetical protein